MDYQAIDDAVRNFLQGEEEKKSWLEKPITLLIAKQLFQQTLAFIPRDNHISKYYSDIQMDTLVKLYKNILTDMEKIYLQYFKQLPIGQHT